MEAGGVQGVTAVLQVSEVLPRMRLLSAVWGEEKTSELCCLGGGTLETP